MIKCLGLVEALIDFSEEDIEEGVYNQGSSLPLVAGSDF